MATQALIPGVPRKREWGTAFQALLRLLGNPDDTVQVFRIMRALNNNTSARNYQRLLTRPDGGRIAWRQVELRERLSDRQWIAGFAPGTVGAAYRAFVEGTGYTAAGLAGVSEQVFDPNEVEHPYLWFGRRERDVHDLWHVLTGYQADDPLGELCLVAFSYAQTGGLGWAFIAAGGALKSIRTTRSLACARAIWEGWRHGRRAAWLLGEDYEALMAEPLEAARRRLGIVVPERYLVAREQVRLAGIVGI